MGSSNKLRVAKVLVIDNTDNILLLRRSKTHPLYAYHWDFPGGEVEAGEDTKSGAVRELLEESGIDIEASRLRVAFEKNTSRNTIHALFTTTLNQATPHVTISWEHDTYVWLTVDKILELEMPEDADSNYIEVVTWLANTKLAS